MLAIILVLTYNYIKFISLSSTVLLSISVLL